jgi:hypothetical protein
MPSQDIVPGLSELSVSQVNFNTVTHAGLKSYQSHPPGNASFPQSSIQTASSLSASISPVTKESTVIPKRTPPPAPEISSSQIRNIDTHLLEDESVRLLETISPNLGPVTILKALQDYNSDVRGFLSFRRGNYIILVQRINDFWWTGTIGDREGIFPSRDVQVMSSDFGNTQLDPELPIAPVISVPQFVKALYDYSSQESVDLEFRKGDVIRVLEVKNRDWWKGVKGDKDGLFPTNHVEGFPPDHPYHQVFHCTPPNSSFSIPPNLAPSTVTLVPDRPPPIPKMAYRDHDRDLEERSSGRRHPIESEKDSNHRHKSSRSSRRKVIDPKTGVLNQIVSSKSQRKQREKEGQKKNFWIDEALINIQGGKVTFKRDL